MNLVSAELIGANACYLSDDSKATCFVLTRVQNTSNAIIIPNFGQGSTNWGILPSQIRKHGVYGEHGEHRRHVKYQPGDSICLFVYLSTRLLQTLYFTAFMATAQKIITYMLGENVPGSAQD